MPSNSPTVDQIEPLEQLTLPTQPHRPGMKSVLYLDGVGSPVDAVAVLTGAMRYAELGGAAKIRELSIKFIITA